MSTRIAMTLAAAVLITCVGPRVGADDKDDAVKKDMKLLEGTWVMQSFENQGKLLADEQVKAITLTIKGDRYMVDLGERNTELTIKIDPTRKLKTIEFTMTQSDEKSVTHGIYEVNEDTFKMCRTTEAGKDRPTVFSTKERSGTAMATYKREKK